MPEDKRADTAKIILETFHEVTKTIENQQTEQLPTPQTPKLNTDFNPLDMWIKTVKKKSQTNPEECAKTTIPLAKSFNDAVSKFTKPEPIHNLSQMVLNKLAENASKTAQTEPDTKCSQHLNQFSQAFTSFASPNPKPTTTTTLQDKSQSLTPAK